ncbi:MAG: MFS transporter [Microthrixaceae bacterium]|nr:MFS transporter [Microthrixaceae bacterium]
MDGTMLGFAVPHLSESLEPTSSQLLWIVDIYSFILAGLLVTMGSVGDRIGRRRLLMIGAAAFSATSVMAAFAPSASALIAARALLGFSGATLMPSTLSLIRNIFPNPQERQVAISIWAASFAIGGAVGPIIGGLLLDHFWWGSVFLVGVPVTVTLQILGPRLVPESRDPSPGRFDIPSSALSIVAMIPTIFAIKMAAERGIDRVGLLALVIGASAGAAFVVRQRRLADPMIDTRLFAIPGFRRAIVANLVASFGFAGGLFFITQYFQLVLGMSALRSGVQLMPAVVAAIVMMLAAPALVRRTGPFQVMTVGLALGTIGFATFMIVDLTGPIALTTLAIAGAYGGLSMAMTVAIDGIMSVIPPERAGAGASVSETSNELGIALGTALLGSVLTAVYRPRIDQIQGVPQNSIEAARETLGAAVIAAEKLPSEVGGVLVNGAKLAFVSGLHTAALIATLALAAVTVWTAAAVRKNPSVSGEPVDARQRPGAGEG